MSITDVSLWLAGGRNYNAGIALLKENGTPSKPLLSLLDRGETGYSRERLAEALTQVLAKAQAAAALASPPKASLSPGMHAKAAFKSGGELDEWAIHQYPVELQEVKHNTRTWLREFDVLYGRMRSAPTKTERYGLALRMKDLDEMIHGAFTRLDTFRSTGTDIGAIQEKPMNVVEMWRKLGTLRTQISKAKTGVRPSSPEQVKNWEQQRDLLITAINVAQQEGR